jgi:hypothetical protein
LVIIAISPLSSAILDRAGKAVKPAPGRHREPQALPQRTRFPDAAKPAQRQDDRK